MVLRVRTATTSCTVRCKLLTASSAGSVVGTKSTTAFRSARQGWYRRMMHAAHTDYPVRCASDVSAPNHNLKTNSAAVTLYSVYRCSYTTHFLLKRKIYLPYLPIERNIAKDLHSVQRVRPCNSATPVGFPKVHIRSLRLALWRYPKNQ